MKSHRIPKTIQIHIIMIKYPLNLSIQFDGETRDKYYLQSSIEMLKIFRDSQTASLNYSDTFPFKDISLMLSK
jgi:hypothetical protein